MTPRRRTQSGKSARGKKPAANKRPPKRPAGRSQQQRDQQPPIAILRAADADGIFNLAIPDTPDLARVAGTWMYILRNRSRWAADEDIRSAMQERAWTDLQSLGLSSEDIGRIAHATSRLVEVEIIDPATTGREASAAADVAASLPWEFVVSAATRHAGRYESLLVIRLLRRPRTPRHRKQAVTRLFIESAPGRLDGIYSFETEFARLNAVIGANGKSDAEHLGWQKSQSETRASLARRVSQLDPDLIHVSGVDNHQVSQFIPGFYDEPAVKNMTSGKGEDGVIVRGTPNLEVPLPYTEFAACLIPQGQGSGGPQLVTLNVYYSGARIARECVRRGAHAALGFMDEVDDRLAEYFFQVFYEAQRDAKDGVTPAAALAQAWNRRDASGKSLYGTGVALWVAESVIESGERISVSSHAATDDRLALRMPTKAEYDAARLRPMRDILRVVLDAPAEVNYSLLHNARPLLAGLTLSKLVDHPLDEVSVDVCLDIGDHMPRFRYTEPLLTEPQRSLEDEVCIPLTAALLRSSRERLRGTFYAKVMWNGRVAFEETKPVTLMPVDEWLDDTANNPWLPSFVLPRDPAVATIIAAARPHLIAVQDDPDAGFDGYQSVPEEIKRTSDCDIVDEQVRAIWTALVHEYRLQYINPPPAYAATTQRLRTPSEILATRSGTCIDLALLLASCLEYVDIYPVIVLLSGHAFVGYWRSGLYHEQFAGLEDIPSNALSVDVGVLSAASKAPLADTFGWRLAFQQYPEILMHLRSGHLRFLEATGLCSNYSFADAVQEGRANLRVAAEFDSLLDVKLARDATPPVTPLPIFAGREA